MAQGRVVFDGTPEELTTEVARELYGADGLAEAFSEAMTSTSLERHRAAQEEEARAARAALAAPQRGSRPSQLITEFRAWRRPPAVRRPAGRGAIASPRRDSNVCDPHRPAGSVALAAFATPVLAQELTSSASACSAARTKPTGWPTTSA